MSMAIRHATGFLLMIPLVVPNGPPILQGLVN